MDAIGRRSHLNWNDDAVRAHVRALEEHPTAHYDPDCAICQAAVERGLWEPAT